MASNDDDDDFGGFEVNLIHQIEYKPQNNEKHP